MSTVIMETFAEFFKYGEPTTKLPDLEVQMPVNALALAVSAVRFKLITSPVLHSTSVHLLGRACSCSISR